MSALVISLGLGQISKIIGKHSYLTEDSDEDEHDILKGFIVHDGPVKKSRTI